MIIKDFSRIFTLAYQVRVRLLKRQQRLLKLNRVVILIIEQPITAKQSGAKT